PGIPSGHVTGDGSAEPTELVPDADRLTPPICDVEYGLTLDLLFDLGSAIRIESPSHPLTVTPEEGERLRVSFASAEVGLDRDVVLIAHGLSDGLLTTVTLHGPEAVSEPGVLALTVVPDLSGSASVAARQDVIFLIDV